MINLKNKKILVTGATGFLGSHVVDTLLSKGIPEVNIFMPSSKDYDLRIWENCEKVVKNQNIVIHVAAMVGGLGLNREKPGELFYNNLIMSVQLMEAARKMGMEKFVAIGTICSYPKITPVPFKEDDIWKGYPEETNAPFGLAKKMTIVQSYAYRQQYKFNAINILPVNLYGPRDHYEPERSHVMPALIKKIADAKKEGRKYIEVWGTGKATREFLYVKDAAEGILLATEKYDKSDPVNLGSGIEISIRELVNILCEIMDYHGEIRWDKTKPDGQPRRLLDTTRAKNEFGFKAQTPFKEGLRKTINWYLKNETI